MSVKRIYVSAKLGNDNNVVIQTRKKADLKVTRLKRNPKKRVISQSKQKGGLQVSYYIDSPDYLCFAYNGQFISIPDESLPKLLQSIEHFHAIKNIREREHLEHTFGEHPKDIAYREILIKNAEEYKRRQSLQVKNQ